ncbi:hypothetical protein [Actinacidiphila paucisporea]|uniref:Secreted protein n=1 Tax=Actinacidiphila paucisporea TaxID=310782 RepID=A0A1M7QPQ5_9ACTN|nr:hypothetical protein [Actinacidiphila paucisporea]SHN33153.1 hypothetical protein SAMN05216499_1393 [Actinacidiphila paucisporea]
MRGAVNLRRAALTAATASVAVLAGILPGTPSAASGPDGSVELAYSCAFTAGTGSAGAPVESSPSTATAPTTATATSAPGAPASGATATADATVTVHQRYPSTGAVGTRIQPGPLTVEVVLDRHAAGAVLPAGTASATATGSLTARVTQGRSAADAVWSGLRAASTPAADGLDLTFTGDATALRVTAPGTVRFDAGRLDLTVYAKAGDTAPPAGSPAPAPPATTPPPAGGTPGEASGAAAPPGTAAVRPAHRAAASRPVTAAAADGGATAACAPKAGQATLLGEVGVAAAPGSRPSGSPTAAPGARPGTAAPGGNGTITLAAPPHSGVSTCPAPPKGEPDQKVLDAQKRPEGSFNIPVAPADRQAECTFLTGLSNVAKLNGASVINDLDEHPALTDVTQTGVWIGFQQDGSLYSEFDSIATLDLPPANSTFLTFGFMPTSAVMSLSQVGVLTLVIVGSSGSDYVTTTTVYGKLQLRLSHVEVNGTPLDVGPDCHTVKPLDIALTGIDNSNTAEGGGVLKPTDYNELSGGPLHQDDLTIPPFTGCAAHGDDVDALLTASISGPGNSLNLIQGPLCIPSAFLNCDPEIPYPTPPHR